MFFEASGTGHRTEPAELTLEDLIAIQPRHIRGRLHAGHRGPEGERPGRGRANTLDFDGLGPYVPGDDIRAIDWRASSRSGQTTVRRFAAASHRAHMLVVDLRPELFFGTSGAVMSKTACLAAAWMAWKAQLLHEPVGLMVGGEIISPRRGRRHVLRLLDHLAAAYSVAENNLSPPVDCETAAALIGYQDELCLISDMPVDSGPLVAAGRALSRNRVLRFLLVEDPIQYLPAVPGRYPVRGEDGIRQVFRIGSAASVEAPVEHLLKDAGWIVEHVRDLLPRRDDP